MGEGAALTVVPGFEKRTVTRTLADYSGIRIAINQVEYTNSSQGPVIHIFGRDVNGTAVHLEATGFRPYFYAPGEQVTAAPVPSGIEVEPDHAYRSIRGETLCRLYTRRPTDVRDYRERYRHYEADIPFATRFLIDNGLTGGVEAPSLQADYHTLRAAEVNAPARTCMMDIECEDERGFPEPERDKIIAVCCWDSFQDDYTSFLLAPAGAVPVICPADERITVEVFQDEKEMLLGLARYMRERDPDILSGWNFLEFDIPYIIARMERLGVNPTCLARLEERTERTALRGRALFDLLDAYKKMHGSQRESYRLDSVAEEEVGETKIRFTGTVSGLWREDPARLVDYNRKDVELCVAINRKNHIIEFYREIARYVGCPLDRTLNSSQVIDIYILRKAFGRFVLPSKGFAAAEEFEGATVFDPSRGVKENVVVLDLKSLYPMAMMTINASPETKDPDGEYRAPNGVRFRREPDGLTRSIIAELLKEREQKKELRNRFAFGSPGVHPLRPPAERPEGHHEHLLRCLGICPVPALRQGDRGGGHLGGEGYHRAHEDRHRISGIPRHLRGHRLVHGPDPPDGGVADHRDGPEDRGRVERELLRVRTKDAERRLPLLLHQVRENLPAVLPGGEEEALRRPPRLEGGEGRRRDRYRGLRAPPLRLPPDHEGGPADRHREDPEGGGPPRGEGVPRRDHHEIPGGKYTLDEIGIPGGIQKALDQYETNDAHRRGAEYANLHLKADFKKGSKPKRIYIRNVKAKYPKTDVLCFEYGDQVPPEFVVDWETMLEKTIRQPISRIIEALGWDWADVDPSRTTLAQWGMG